VVRLAIVRKVIRRPEAHLDSLHALDTLARVSLPFRSRVEHAAFPVLDRLERLPRLVPFLVVLALLVVGILVPGWGFVATALVALAVAFLIYYTWPRLTMPERLMRIAVLAIVVAVTIVQAVPRV
jgi:multisubunit Na+/H+ antiporter MnhB subunit